MNLDLAPGERLIWQGQPRQGLRLAPQDAFAIPFAAFWLFVVLVIFGLIFSGEVEVVNPLAYIVAPIFLLVGLHMLIGRFLVDRTARRRVHYYLTSERAVVEGGLRRPSRRSASLAATPEIRLRGARHGRGTVWFGAQAASGMLPPSWPGAENHLPPAFHDIEDAEQVYALALAAQRALLQAGATRR